jgi:hypothetical protein
MKSDILGKSPPYRAYMLRFWEVAKPADHQPAVWRFSIEDAHTGTRRIFVAFEELVAFLQNEVANAREDIATH